jgi:peptidylprolyl isomerase
MTTDKDYYAILGVSPDADPQTIEDAYERLAREVQPNADLEPTDPERMSDLDEAFDVLDDPESRAQYDRARNAPASESAAAAPAWTDTAPAATAEAPASADAAASSLDAELTAAPAAAAKSGRDAGLIAGIALLVGGVAVVVAGLVVLVLALTDDGDGSGETSVTEGGVQITDTTTGYGRAAQSGDVLTVHYTGTLEDGTQFDSSVGEMPFAFIIDSGRVIPGWDEGVKGMQTGGKRTLVIPPELAYGDQENGPIPANSTLIFEIEALSVSEAAPQTPPEVDNEGEEQDSGMVIIDVEEGRGTEAKTGDNVYVHYTGWLEDGTQFDSSLVTPEVFRFTIGGQSVIPGWDQGVPGMKEGGTRRLIIPPELAYGQEGAGEGTIPPDATLIFDIQLVEVAAAPQ